MAHPIENIMEKTMSKLREMVDVNTIVGDPVVITGETMVLPVSKVSLGFVSGGGEYPVNSEKTAVKKSGDALDALEGKYPFAGVAAAGITLNPTAFLSVCDKKVRVLPAQSSGGIERAIEMLPEVIGMIERLACGDNKSQADTCVKPGKEQQTK